MIWSGCLVLIVLVASLGSWTLWSDYKDRQHMVGQRTRIMAAAIAGYMNSAIQQRQLGMDALANHLSHQAWPFDDEQTRKELDWTVDADPEKNPLIVSAAGHRWSISELPRFDLEELVSQRDGLTTWFAEPLQFDGKSWLPLIRRYRHANGEAFSVGALVPLATFQRYVQSLNLPADLPIAVLDAQGRNYLQDGRVPSSALLPGEEGLQRLEADRVQGVLLVRKAVPGYPLNVVLARWPDEYLASWYQQKSLTLIAVGFSILVILWLAAELVSAWRLLTRSERRYRQLFQSINDGVLVIGQTGVVEANARAAELFGVSSGSCLVALRLVDLCTSGQVGNRPIKHWLTQLLAEVEQGSELFTTLKFKRLDSPAEFVCDVHLSSISLGPSNYLLVCMHDISARRQAEDELQASRQKLLEAQAIAGLGVWSWAAGARHVSWTDGCAGIFGLPDSVSECTADDVLKSITAEERPDAVEAFQRALNGERLDIELQIQRPDGEVRNVQFSGELRQHDGNPQLLGAMLDVTTQKRVQHELEAANTRLQRMSGQVIEVQERERQHLARELHDDIGQLLTFIKISAAGVRRHLVGEQEQRQAALVRIADEALSKVRDLSRMLRPAQLDGLGLVAAMRWQVETFLPQLSDGVRCRLHLEELQPRPAPDLEITLFRIFQEALSNVLKHASASLVEVHLERRDGRVELTITDNGQGFDASAALHSDKGIGLMSMAERAKLVGGEFRLNSSQGGGTQIGVGIPEHNNNNQIG